ncbi:transcriptional-regulating factor 1 isoform X7 [Zootoca vivipara]|uniref:transcriptional-regulating factor 1 isoform X7 n=1 Tax=Zootoca vivipara TaxID=8524 RepID=UPI00293C050F|nr:transcriptional-regulating factor 1 isoform X7 [Zootoca vivipara]
MGDQQMYKTSHVVNNNESLYYHHQQQQQQQQHLNSLAPLNHSYGTSAMDATQESPLSPSFSQETRENIALNAGSKTLGLMDSPRQSSWAHLGSGNHVPVRNNQNVMWGSAGQGEVTDGYEHLCSQANEVRPQKMTSGVLHKLDSFAQVFANQNLRIQVNNVSQVIQPSAMGGTGDSALRQLLSQKPAVEQQPVQRYQQVPQQVHQGFVGTPQKQHMHMMAHQQPLYYDEQQHLAHLQMHPAMHQGQAHFQQMHSQHLLPPQQLQQDQYYLQQQQQQSQQGQHRLLIHELQQQQQQQRQCPVQTAQYYSIQPMMQHLQQQQQQQMQMQLPAFHRDPDQKPLHETHQYSQDRGHSVQLIQLGAVPQYFYQDQQQPFRHLYSQSLLQQQPSPGDASQPNHYQSNSKAQALMDSHLGFPLAEGTEGPAQQDMNSVAGGVPQQPLIPPESIHVDSKGPQPLSPGPMWPQQVHLPDGRLRSVSPEQSSIHDPPPYTPPPMLSPVRHGSGLFSSVITSAHGASHPQLPLTPLTPTPRILLCQSNSVDGASVPITPGPGEQTIDVEPHINIGSRFQANIPELEDRGLVGEEDHKATLVWKPGPELEDKDIQQRVTSLLNLCCSSVLTGGGTNLEYGLHSLFEAKGDVMVALEMLLLLKPARAKSHPLASYHYAGSDQWTPIERKLFSKALHTYSKDFILVQKMVKSKTVAQCVEYYYTWKKIMHLGRKHRTRLAEVKNECLTSGEDDELEEEEQAEADKKSVKEEAEIQNSPEPPSIIAAEPINLPSLQSPTLPATSFTCEMPDCGAMFNSRPALNGHVRIHGGTNPVTKTRGGSHGAKQKSSSQNDYGPAKNSPAHSTTSGETDPTTLFPCKECGKMFFKIKSRNAHMKTHRQQEEQQRQKAQKAAVAAEMAATIARTSGPSGHSLIPLDHLDLIKQVEEADDLSSDVVQELGEVMDGTEVIDPDLLLDEEDTDLLQDDVEL